MKHFKSYLLILALFITSGFVMITTAAAQTERIVPADQQQIKLSFAPLVRKVSPAVVNIYTKRTVARRTSPFMNDPFFEFFFGQSFGGQNFGGLNRERIESALGSGVIVDDSGLVITNAHVIRDADEITVVLPDGREFAAEKQLVDEPSDLAVLKVEHNDETLPYVTLKPSETLAVGDLVLAIGNPFGVGQTVTSGIVSALSRSRLNINDFDFFIQTDAAINPGNSGGPLVAMDGSVVGINTAIFSRSGGSLGIGFAIPSEMVATVLAAAKAGQTGEGAIIRPWLGITAQTISTDLAESLDLDTTQGVLVSGFRKASPLRKAGLRQGDVVVAVNGKTVRNPAEMKFRTATVPLGEDATFTFIRNGKERSLRVEMIAPPDEPPRNETMLTGSHPLRGAQVSNINPAVAVELGLKEEEGVVVTGLSRRSQASRFVRPGDIIMSVNDNDIDDVDELQDELEDARRGWSFVINRNGRVSQVIVR